MYISNFSFLKQSFPLLKEKILNALEYKLNEQQQRVALIASVIFAAIAACMTLYYFVTRNAKSHEIKAELTVQTDENSVKTTIDNVARTRLSSDRSVDSPNEKATEERKKGSDRRNNSTERTSLDKKGRTSLKASIPADFKSNVLKSSEHDDSDEYFVNDDDELMVEANLDDDESYDVDFQILGDDNWEGDVDDYLSGMMSDYSPPTMITPKYKCSINGKEVSYRTYRCLEILEKRLDLSNKVFGTAIDTGDCFFDAFAQRLSLILKRPVTIKELRERVSEEVKRLDKFSDEENWIKKQMMGDMMDSYDDYRDRVAYTCEEIKKNNLKFYPVWGHEKRDGLILCHAYKVNLKVYTVGTMSDIEDAMEDDDNFYIGEDDEIPSKLPYPNTIEIALYPGHFVPVHDKSETGLKKIEKSFEKLLGG